MLGKCKLCGEVKELCNQSHIIPNFMYKDLFDEKHRAHVIKSQKGSVQQIGYRQSGEFDKNILCQKCDNEILGKLDRYASLILFDGYPKILENRVSPNGMRFTYCAEIDYKKFKLFLLSILWRASISSKPLFVEVELGPHQEIIRQMLLTNSPGEHLEYPCLILTYLHLKSYPKDVVAQPSKSRIDGGYVYKLLIGGMIYIFFISKHIIPSELMDVAISPNGEMKIIHSPPRTVQKVLKNITGVDFT